MEIHIEEFVETCFILARSAELNPTITTHVDVVESDYSCWLIVKLFRIARAE